jgi:hypothetical protein
LFRNKAYAGFTVYSITRVRLFQIELIPFPP